MVKDELYMNIDAIIAEVLERFLIQEAKKGLNRREFLADCKSLGLEIESTKKGEKIKYNGKIVNSNHARHANIVDAATLRDIATNLKKFGYFSNPKNIESFPWKKWEISDKAILNGVSIDTTEQEINHANQLYMNAEVKQVYQDKGSVCILERDQEPQYNLCRSTTDGRPLLDRWCHRCETLNSNPTVLALKFDNLETITTEAYPIFKDGSIGEMIEESKKYNKRSNYRLL